MNRFWQTDPALIQEMKDGGCGILSAMELSPTVYQVADANTMYAALLQVNFIEPDCTILSWDNVLNSVGPRLHYRKTVNDIIYVCAIGEAEIIKWWMRNVKEDHFTTGDGHGNCAWNSMNNPSIMSAYADFVERYIVSTV